MAPKVAAQLPKYFQNGLSSQSNQAPSKSAKKDERSSSYENEPDIVPKRAGEMSDAEQQLRDQIASQQATSPEHTAHKSRNSILDSSTHLRSSNRNQNSAIQVEDQNQEASSSAEAAKQKAEKDGRGSKTEDEGVGGGFAPKDADEAPTQQMQAFQKVSAMLTKQNRNQAHAAEPTDFGQASIPVVSEETRSRPLRQEEQPRASPASKEPTRSAERRLRKSNERSS